MAETKDYLILNGEKVSPETLQPIGAPPSAKHRKPLWFRLFLRHPLLSYLILVGGTGAILSHYWRVVEKIAPPLNEFIHRDISDSNDAQYQLYKFGQSRKRYMAATAICNAPDASFGSCRSAVVASKPSLDDMGSRVGKLQTAWQNEVAAKTMPQTCRDAVTSRYGELAEYVSHELRISDVFEAADPSSEESVAKARQQLDQFVSIESQAVDQMRKLPPRPRGCAGF